MDAPGAAPHEILIAFETVPSVATTLVGAARSTEQEGVFTDHAPLVQVALADPDAPAFVFTREVDPPLLTAAALPEQAPPVPQARFCDEQPVGGKTEQL